MARRIFDREFVVEHDSRQPSDCGALSVRAMSEAQLGSLAASIRGLLVEKVCATGGHLGVNLGVVELTVALHRVFESPRDVLLFDTGHQAYVHKMLTGRAGRFDSLRQRDGLSGYPSQSESPHDWVENSHASTALAYADGFAKAFHLSRRSDDAPDRHVVAVIGDGAMTGGLAWEGLNNLAAAPHRPLVVVLNDNGRSYGPTVGGIARHLEVLRTRGRWPGPEHDNDAPAAQYTVFEQLGLAYLGPVDGHDIAGLQAALSYAKELKRTVVVHVVTEKGKGWAPAETDPTDRMHGVGILDPTTGKSSASNTRSWTSVFGREIAQIGERDPNVVAVTAAMLHPVGLAEFAARFPDRVFDVGIAEQQAACSAAGMAMAGLHPVVAIYATFLNRAFDQVLLDVALHRLSVTFVLDRAGITGPDGASHHGMWDTSILAAVPGLRMAAPRDPARLRELLNEAVTIQDGPTVIRFPKANAGPDLPPLARIDGVDVLYRSPGLPLDVLIVACGVMAQPALHAAQLLHGQGIGVTVIDPRWLFPIHSTAVHVASRHAAAVTVEDSGRVGGFGSQFTLACADAAVGTPIRVISLPQRFIAHGDRQDLLNSAGLNADHIASVALSLIRHPVRRPH